MIFITVGTTNKGFDRLLSKCDEIAERSGLVFFAQTGNSGYKPKHFDYKQWLSQTDMLIKYQEAAAFLVHGGFGTLSEVLSTKKPVVVVPRSRKDEEAVNNQGDICRKLDQMGYVKCVEDIERLSGVLSNIGDLRLVPYELESDIPSIVKDHVNTLRIKIKKT